MMVGEKDAGAAFGSNYGPANKRRVCSTTKCGAIELLLSCFLATTEWSTVPPDPIRGIAWVQSSQSCSFCNSGEDVTVTGQRALPDNFLIKVQETSK
jgi:hypothetical protein